MDAITLVTQLGGCIMVSMGNAIQRVVELELDYKSLGRWAWMKYQGKQNYYIRFISAYQCGTSSRPSAVHSQQKQYLDKADNKQNLKEVFQKDLCIAI